MGRIYGLTNIPAQETEQQARKLARQNKILDVRIFQNELGKFIVLERKNPQSKKAIISDE